MKTLSIKNLKVAKFASEETLCFQASIYVDGKRAFTARNEGQGGCNFYEGPADKIKEAEDWAASQPGALGVEDLDTEIHNAINDAEIAKAVKKMLRTLCIFVEPDCIYEWKCSPDDESARDFIKKSGKYPNPVILNDVTLDKAIGFYKRLPGCS